jgi:hypothetical protein
MKQKRKLRIFISNTFYPAKEPSEGEEGSVASWELRVEGRLLEDSKNDPNKVCIVILFLCFDSKESGSEKTKHMFMQDKMIV